MQNLDGHKILHLIMVYFMMLSLILDCVLLNSRIVLLKYLNITSCLLVDRECWGYMDCSKQLTFHLEEHSCVLYISTGKYHRSLQ